MLRMRNLNHDTSARAGDLSAAALVGDRHGLALFLLAFVILGDREEAEAVVVQAIADACTEPATTRPGHTERHDLARLTCLRCLRLRSDAEPVLALRRYWEVSEQDSVLSALDNLRLVALHQRATIALIQFGDHDYRDVAGLLGVPAPTVAGLLRSYLRELRLAGDLPPESNWHRWDTAMA